MNVTQYIGEQFGKPTGIGGKISTFVMNQMNQKQYNATQSLLKLSDDERVLDIGFGNGYFLRKLSRKSNSQLYGIDVSDDMVQYAKHRLKKQIAQGTMAVEQGDVMHLDFPDGYFDKVCSINTLYFWRGLGPGLREIHRVLKPEGVFITAIYSKEFLESWSYTQYGFAKYTLQEIEEAAVRHGFTVHMTTIKKGVSYCFAFSKVG